MRHIIELDNRINEFDMAIDKSDYIEHSSTLRANYKYATKIDFLKWFKSNYDENKIKETLNKNITRLEKEKLELANFPKSKLDEFVDGWNTNKELYDKLIQQLEWFIQEANWVLTDPEIHIKYKKDIETLNFQIEKIKKEIIEKQKIIDEIENEYI